VPTQKTTSPLAELSEKFVRLYGTDCRFVQAPGRVNLIGEHTDYNDGFVLPAAIPLRATIGIAQRSDRRLVLFSENYDEKVEFDLGQLPETPRRHWSDYGVGVARKLLERGVRLPGANLLIDGKVPQGAGLSSSASLEVGICYALLELAQEKMDGAEMAHLCQSAENDFVGARCGIMDQFASIHGKKDHALLLDCRLLSYQYLPIPHEVHLVICNTMVRHSLAGGEYNNRRRECEVAAKFFSEKMPGVKALRDVALDNLEKYGREMPESVRTRSRHVIAENSRVLEAARALGRGDAKRFGQLMMESHASLRDDFEVSCRELDVMVELACKIRGVYGARMTGGGFGGCTINLVESESVDEFATKMAEGYEKATGLKPEIYICEAAEGVRDLK
jgi:galactokinase